MLQYNNVVKGIIERTFLPYSPNLVKTNNVYFAYNQFVQKCESFQAQILSERLKNYNAEKKVSRLGETLRYYQRFMALISEGNVPRLQQLVAVALRRNRSIPYIIDKVLAAIDGLYVARPIEDDKDLAYLILKLGGPALLTICYQANKLPSTSTAYRLAKTVKPLECNVRMTIKDCFEANVRLDPEACGISLKADETYITQRPRYDSRNDMVQGTCYQHSDKINLTFNTYEESQGIEMAIKNNITHLTKDLLVFALNNMCDDSALQVILAWPSCQKDDVHGTIKLFGDTSELYYKTTGNKVMNFSSDGDGTRRIAFHELTSFNINISTPLGAMISKMDFLDSNGKYQETVSFDPKHLVKRCWTNMINESCIINDIPLMKKDLADLIALSENDLGFQVISLLYPKDKQNVPSATAFLLRFISLYL